MGQDHLANKQICLANLVPLPRPVTENGEEGRAMPPPAPKSQFMLLPAHIDFPENFLIQWGAFFFFFFFLYFLDIFKSY